MFILALRNDAVNGAHISIRIVKIRNVLWTMNSQLRGENLLQKEELYGLYFSPNIIPANQSRMERAGHILCVRDRETHRGFGEEI